MSWKNMPDGPEKKAAYHCSREWGVLQEKVRKRCKKICERCHKNKMYAVHHLTYIRMYKENLEDLQGLCDGCHKFIHGRSDVDPVNEKSKTPEQIAQKRKREDEEYIASLLPPEQMAQKQKLEAEKYIASLPKSIYLAGKIEKDRYRFGLVECCLDSNESNQSWQRQSFYIQEHKMTYTGPYTTGCDHGCTHNVSHAYVKETGCCGDFQTDMTLPSRCLAAIKEADYFFAWIDDETCFGTLVEIGWAKMLKKKICIAGTKAFAEMWFAYSQADKTYFYKKLNPYLALRLWLEGYESSSWATREDDRSEQHRLETLEIEDNGLAGEDLDLDWTQEDQELKDAEE